MKVAVTGATGFVGRHVLLELARRGVETVAVTRSPAAEYTGPPCAKVVQLDIHDASIDAYWMLGQPDVLIHLAWGGLPNYRSLHHFEEELPAHFRFLKSMVESGLANLVVVGTCFEYGMQSGPLTEDLQPRPDNPYGFAKDALRQQLEFFKGMHSFTLTWARLFYLHGDGQAETSLLPLLRSAVERGETVFNMSGGEQLRDYLAINLVAEYIVALASARRDVGPVNICSGEPVSVRSLVEGWIRENDWKIDLNLGYYPYPDYEPMAFWGSREKLVSVLADVLV